jgi:hypothetical protein
LTGEEYFKNWTFLIIFISSPFRGVALESFQPGGIVAKTKRVYKFLFIILLAVFLSGNSFGKSKKANSAPEKKELQTIDSVKDKYTDSLLAIPGVNGIGITDCEKKDCILITVEKLTPELKKKLPKTLDSYPVKIEEIGEIIPFSESGCNNINAQIETISFSDSEASIRKAIKTLGSMDCFESTLFLLHFEYPDPGSFFKVISGFEKPTAINWNDRLQKSEIPMSKSKKYRDEISRSLKNQSSRFKIGNFRDFMVMVSLKADKNFILTVDDRSKSLAAYMNEIPFNKEWNLSSKDLFQYFGYLLYRRGWGIGTGKYSDGKKFDSIFPIPN